MQHTFKTILFTFLATTALASCSAIKNTFWNNDTAEDTVEYSDNGFETRLCGENPYIETKEIRLSVNTG